MASAMSPNDPGFVLKETLLANLRNARWHPGQKLPTEREMSMLYNVGRSTVRRALGEMKQLGVITQTVGSGTYVAKDAVEKLPKPVISDIGISPAELMQARLMFEPVLIDLAIRNGTTADFAEMESCCRSADAAETLEQFEYWDGEFHHRLAQATHNGFIVTVSTLMSKVRDHGEWGLLKKKSATPERRVEYLREHWAVVAALRNRDSETAKQALVKHLRNVRRNMFEY
jgi:DNA-binding FadR family transcriptional regulator